MKLFKNLTAIALAAVMTVALVGCGSNAASSDAASSASSVASSEASSSSEAVDTSDAVYTINNTTGMNVTELYLYAAGSEDKGTNYAAEGLAADAAVEVTTAYSEEAAAGTYVLEFTTEDGATQKFETLYFEVATINLLSVDAAAGATPIAFGY